MLSRSGSHPGRGEGETVGWEKKESGGEKEKVPPISLGRRICCVGEILPNNRQVVLMSWPQHPRQLLVIATGILLLSWTPLASGSLFSIDAEPQENNAPFKGFSGLRAYNRSKRVVYWHDQTVSVIELGPNRLILNCELIEAYEPKERDETLARVSKFAKPHRIKLSEMMDLMDRCTRLETPLFAKKFTKPSHQEDTSNSKGRGGGSSLFSGVIPGTKWCGTGDIADTYFDLGEDEIIDRCCRTHDLCPSKVRGHSSRYNITNDNMYTKSHCMCDLMFQKCLRNTKSSTADIMGHFYFDLLKIPCIDERGGEMVIRTSEPYSS